MNKLPPNPKRPGFMQQKTHVIDYHSYDLNSIVSQRNNSFDTLLKKSVGEQDTFSHKCKSTIGRNFSNLQSLINQSNESFLSQGEGSSSCFDDLIDLNVE